MNEYNVSITIESNEELETFDFIVYAETFEDAVASIKNDLDI